MFTRSQFRTPDMLKQHEILNKISDMIDALILQTMINEAFKKEILLTSFYGALGNTDHIIDAYTIDWFLR